MIGTMRTRYAPARGLGLAVATSILALALAPTVAEANPFSSWSDFTNWEHSTLTKAHLNSWSNFTNWEHQTATDAHLNSWSSLTNALDLTHAAKKPTAAAAKKATSVAALPRREAAIDVPRAGSTSTTATPLHRRVEAQVLEPPSAVSSSSTPVAATSGSASTPSTSSTGTGQFEAQQVTVPEPSTLWVLAAGVLAAATRRFRRR
jgi:PEP-CTERM motif